MEQDRKLKELEKQVREKEQREADLELELEILRKARDYTEKHGSLNGVNRSKGKEQKKRT
ncbi:hypothetical protein J2T17_003410 [Paenibacillus mucilaginosus]|uniref:hypothetical protein n=1 Tax=Paenibacillus mucilaginosus TaxID=61624 RepID=UPI003D191DAE